MGPIIPRIIVQPQKRPRRRMRHAPDCAGDARATGERLQKAGDGRDARFKHPCIGNQSRFQAHSTNSVLVSVLVQAVHKQVPKNTPHTTVLMQSAMNTKHNIERNEIPKENSGQEEGGPRPTQTSNRSHATFIPLCALQRFSGYHQWAGVHQHRWPQK